MNKKLSSEMKESFRQAEILLMDTKPGEIINFDNMFLSSSYGRPTELQVEVVKATIKGRAVYDLGAGDCSLSEKLLSWGASNVVAIEKETSKRPNVKGLKLYNGSFKHFLSMYPSFRPPKDAVAFISWPANHEMEGLITLMRKFSTVIYLGNNTEGSCCAWPEFFRELVLWRPLISFTPNRRNTLLVYGKRQKKRSGLKRPWVYRKLVLEEIAGINDAEVYGYTEVYGETK